MDIHLTAAGTPAQVTQDLAKQLKALRSDAPDGWATTLAGVRQDVARELQQSGAENVQADLHITLNVTSLEASDVLRAFSAGQRLPGAPVSEYDRQNKGELETRRAALQTLQGAPAATSSTVPVPGESAPQRRRDPDAAAAAAEPATPPK